MYIKKLNHVAQGGLIWRLLDWVPAKGRLTLFKKSAKDRAKDRDPKQDKTSSLWLFCVVHAKCSLEYRGGGDDEGKDF